MRVHRITAVLAAVCLTIAASASADLFSGFTMDFVAISGDASAANGTPWGTSGDTFSDPDSFRMGTYEVTNAQWSAFVAAAGVPIGVPAAAYNSNPPATGANKPVGNSSFFEAAQFVNWLNTSTGNQAAYKFVETTPGDPATLTFGVWSPAEAAGGTNLYRHKDAMYFLPTLHEVLKAAYWNGTSFNTYANATDTLPTPAESCFSASGGLWDVGSGAVELNGTFDMMGNMGEMQENDVNFLYPAVTHMHRWGPGASIVPSSFAAYGGWTGFNGNQTAENTFVGLRVASVALATTGDFDGDGDVDSDDIDDLCANLSGSGNPPSDPMYDLDGDGDADQDDMDMLIHDLVEITGGDGTGTEYGDFDLDGDIDTTDLTILATNYGVGTTWAEGNANCDLVIDTTDLTIMATNFGFVASGAVPEPATMSLLALGGLAVLRRKRK